MLKTIQGSCYAFRMHAVAGLLVGVILGVAIISRPMTPEYKQKNVQKN